jgi:glutamine synthetase
MAAARNELILLAWCDLVGITRGRGIPMSAYRERLKLGINWAMAGHALTPFEDIADNPWGAVMEAQMLPDPATRVRVDLAKGYPPLSFVLCDGYNLDGSVWDSCTRGFCRAALQDLEKETGFRIYSSAELEFTLKGERLPNATPFSLEAFRSVPDFALRCVEALRLAGTEPETFEPEYGVGQFEVSCRPAVGLAGADRTVIVKEVLREVARRFAYRASFTPKVALDKPGNGAHVHFSLQTKDGKPATYDPSRPGGLSEKAAQFAAGVVRHTPALCAFTAPSPPSYFRLGPQHWSSGYACLGFNNREASLRICVPPKGDAARMRRLYNLEYRPIDSTSNPYLVLGLLVRAGLQGIREKLPPPELTGADPHDLGAEKRRKLGIATLPGSLSDALDTLERDKMVRGWFSDSLWSAYRSVKRKEVDMFKNATPEDIMSRYANAY